VTLVSLAKYNVFTKLLKLLELNEAALDELFIALISVTGFFNLINPSKLALSTESLSLKIETEFSNPLFEYCYFFNLF
jgi:hypothetical protein